MSMLLTHPDTPDHLLELSSVLTDFVAKFDLTPKRNVIVYCFDASEPDWEHDPTAWFDPLADRIVVNLGKVWKSIATRSAVDEHGVSVADAYRSNFSGDSSSGFTPTGSVLTRAAGLISLRTKSANPVSTYRTFADTAEQTYSDSLVVDVHDSLVSVLTVDSSIRPVPVHLVIADTLIAILLHETGHAVFSRSFMAQNDNWVAPLSGYEKQILTVLEELRVERQQIARIGSGIELLRHAADIVVDPASIISDIEKSRSSNGISRAGFALNVSLYLGRAQYGVFDGRSRDVESVSDFVQAFVGKSQLAGMRDVWSRYSSVREEDSDAMMSCVSDWKEMFPDGNSAFSSQAPSNREKSEKNSFGVAWRRDSRENSINRTRMPVPSATGESDVISSDDVDFYDLDGELGSRIRESVDSTVADPGESDEHSTKRLDAAKAYSMSFTLPEVLDVPRLAKRVALSDPSEADYRLANSLTKDLIAAKLSGRARVVAPSKIPPGRIDMRAALQSRVDRSAGRASTVAPFKKSRRETVPNAPLSVAVLTDVSSSHGWAQSFNARMTYIVCSAVNRVNGRAAAVTFGSTVTIVQSPRDCPNRLVTVAAVDQTEEFDQACGAADHLLRLTSVDGVKIIFVITDGMMVKQYEMTKTAAWVRDFTQAGCVVVWVTPYGRDYVNMDGLPLLPEHAHPLVVDKAIVASDPSSVIEQIVDIVRRAVRQHV